MHGFHSCIFNDHYFQWIVFFTLELVWGLINFALTVNRIFSQGSAYSFHTVLLHFYSSSINTFNQHLSFYQSFFVSFCIYTSTRLNNVRSYSTSECDSNLKEYNRSLEEKEDHYFSVYFLCSSHWNEPSAGNPSLAEPCMNTHCRLRAVGCHVKCPGNTWGMKCLAQQYIIQQFLCQTRELNQRGHKQ